MRAYRDFHRPQGSAGWTTTAQWVAWADSVRIIPSVAPTDERTCDLCHGAVGIRGDGGFYKTCQHCQSYRQVLSAVVPIAYSISDGLESALHRYKDWGAGYSWLSYPLGCVTRDFLSTHLECIQSTYGRSTLGVVMPRNESALTAAGVRWREEKAGVHEVLAQGEKAWAESGGDEQQATAAMRAWFKAQPKDSPVQALSRYVYFLPDGTLCRDADLRSPNPRPNLQYHFPHPVTNQPCRMHPNGWAYSPKVMKQKIAEGRITFGRATLTWLATRGHLLRTTITPATSPFRFSNASALTVAGTSKKYWATNASPIPRTTRSSCAGYVSRRPVTQLFSTFSAARGL